ncbi:DUF305 domain-containing protein [Gordonia sp. TBRC 11910]|uniref:DUF305 domain-containing protein n=1 Tax=Gordonia asplenii TaxID=2725283 RepID=A0A848KR60_9ACTN|nr:DUF305 domain-containing protein [Gordonia asplenii]NMO01186.1 DUF305 domain-containing protein [Gordonia asplenii]
MSDDTTTPEPTDTEPSTAETTSAATESNGRRGVVTLVLGAVALLLIGLGLGVGLGTWLSSNVPDDDVPAANSAAVGFAQDMTRHHEQGVQMAALAMNNGVDPQVKSLAYDIVTTQSNEIGQMQSWLTRWGYPIINPGEPMAWMGHDMASMDMSAMPGMSMAPSSAAPSSTMVGGHDHGSMPMPMPSTPATTPAPSTSAPSTEAADTSADEPPMPGMATEAEMAKLRSLKGRDSDVYFLQLMLRHHQGGAHMMAYAADPKNVSQDYVRDLASTMERTQGNEIKTLQAMLATYGAPELPMN